MLEEKQNIELSGEAKEAELCERKAKVPSLSDKVHQKSGVLCGMAAVFSVITLVCLYGNPDGIAGTFWAVCIFVLFFAVFGLLGLSVKKESYFLASGTILLALSNACTLNSFFHFFNWIGIFILLTLFFLNQFYETEAWGIWETAKNGFLLWLHSFACIGEPFYNLRKRAPEHENSRKYGTMLVLTICFCLPVLIVMALILSSADQVFARLIKRLFFFPFWNGELWGYAVWLVLGFFGFYCLISAGGKSRGSGKGRERIGTVSRLWWPAVCLPFYTAYSAVSS